MNRIWIIFAAVGVVFLGSLGATGVVMASDQAVPGDFLYGVDRAVESVQLQLAYRPEKKATLELAFAGERLDELSVLGDVALQSQAEAVIGDFDTSMAHAVNLVQSNFGDAAQKVLAVFDSDSDLNSGGDDEEDAEEDDDDRLANCQVGAVKEHPVAKKLAVQFEVDITKIMGSFCSGYGFGEIRIAYEAAQDSGLSVEELFAMRKEGLGWGEVLDTIGLKGKPDDDDTDEVDDGEDDDGEEDDGEDDDGEDVKNESDRGSNCSDDRKNPHGLTLAEEIGVHYEEIMGWFCKGFGFGEIKLAYSLSEQSGVPVDTIFTERAGGKGWGILMKELGGENKPEKGKKDKDD